MPAPVAREDRRKFLARIAPGVSADDHQAIATGIDRVLAWTAEAGNGLGYRSPSGKDPLLGATFADGAILFWGIYPRQLDGGKVTLFPGTAARLAPAARLEGLQPGLRLGPSQNLCMSLRRLGHPEVWPGYRAVLDDALAHRGVIGA